MLNIDRVSSGYGKLAVLHEVSCAVSAGQVLAVVGANGAGKTTLLRTVNGLIPAKSGHITLGNSVLSGMKTERMAAAGLAHVPENRLVFPTLTVQDNLELGAWSRGSSTELEGVLELFPRLVPRLGLPAGALSGGEQQMLAIGRALMSQPSVLILDEPSTGLAPRIVTEIMGVLRRLADTGIAILLVEQNVRASFKIADRALVMRRGRVELEGRPEELLAQPAVRHAYLGGADTAPPPVPPAVTGHPETAHETEHA